MRISILASALALATLTAGCAGLSDREQRILSGAAIGGVVGNVVTEGSTGGTVGGAIIGGAIGSQVDGDRDREDKIRRDRDYRRRMDDCMRWYTYRYCRERVPRY